MIAARSSAKVDPLCRRVLIKGRVQGVWFRGWSVQQAQALGLDGWIRNLPDGDVEAVICGGREGVEEMIRRFWQGPRLAKVIAVEETPEPERPDSGFYQIR